MATTRIMPLHIGKGRTESRAISDIIDYVANPQKTDNGKLITGYGCDSRTADAEFLLAKRQYIAATGRVRGTDDVIAYHVRQSFKPGEITPEEANRLGVEFAKRFTKGNHAFVVCTHIVKSHVHKHIIWAAGKRSLMRDYAILMIHNPMLPDDDGGEPSDMVTAFTKQIETIYRKRFGLKAEHVRAIMDGQAGKDGTYFDAQAAVKAGSIPAEHVIHTSKQLCRKVHDEIEGLTDTAAIQELMSRVSAGNKPFKGIEPTLTETENDMANENKTQGFEYGAIAASLGMKDGEVKDVMARISELAAMEPKYREIQKSLSDAQTVIAGKDASIRNLQTDLAAATARLSAYEQKEKDEQASRIETLVENAIAEGKIDREAKTQWVEMAGSNFELAESTLASIPAREKISKEIADDPANIQATAEATKTAEQLMAEKVAEVVGADFKFRKL